ncbi:hypothetical protein SEA_BEUFFERT_164 [Streptomyces phage Beuffert]|nr:hypothetical protein SEA_BEUFFERT_164 [Streptomyces phage Beuffert]
MQYEKALKTWGAKRLSTPRKTVNPDIVTVEMEFNEGYACCGGRDPNCYCSYAESPSANVVITAGKLKETINVEDFDFAEILGEIVKAADGAITE